jgi:hypothetical protein
MLIQDQVTVFQWLYIQYGGPRLACCLTLQHYFGTTLLNGCRPLRKTRSSDISGCHADFHEGRGIVGEWQGRGMACVNASRHECGMACVHLAFILICFCVVFLCVGMGWCFGAWYLKEACARREDLLSKRFWWFVSCWLFGHIRRRIAS